MILQQFIFLILLVMHSFTFVDLLSQFPIIFIVSYDAFRYDYVSKGVIPALSKLRESGTFAEYIDNVFPTKTFTNHHSIATGVYPEFHGVLGNNLYDSLYKKKLDYSHELWHYSNETLPIWIANEMKGGGRHSGVMMWPGNEYKYNGIAPTYQKVWDSSESWEKRIDVAIDWILNPDKPANLVLLYIEEPDYHGHCFGVESPDFLNELSQINNITKYILNKLEVHNLTNHVNIFFLSDHGMLSSNKKNVIDLNKIISHDLYDEYENSPGLHIYPKPGKASIVYDTLKKAAGNGSQFSVYKTSDIPNRYHFKNNRRAPPILALANPPYVFHDFYKHVQNIEKIWNFTAKDTTPFGIHGYDNNVKLMKPFFLAVGPKIKKNFQIQPFKILDLFSLWAHMSGFPEYAEKTNGSLKIVLEMLSDSKSSLVSSKSVKSILLRVLLVGILLNAVIYFIYRKWYFRKKTYMNRLSRESIESTQKLLEAEEET